MPNINKPNDINNIWAATGDVVAPSSSKTSAGWIAEIPPHEYFNWLDNRQDRFNAHVNQHGTPVWDATTEYQAGLSYTKGSDGKIYFSLTTNTNVNPVGDTTGAWVDSQSSGLIVISTTGLSTFNVPLIFSSGFKKPKIIVQGGGGSGATGINGIRGGGGGAGGTAIGIVDLTGQTAVSVRVGLGAAAIGSANQNGVAGGLSTFGTLSANGGQGGTRYATTLAPSGGFGGTASGGTLNIRGGDGSDGTTLTLGGIDYNGGSADGGASHFGGGLRGGSGPGTPSTTQAAPGSGGGGGTDVSARGSNGIIVIEW